jgi:hypothetical protein
MASTLRLRGKRPKTPSHEPLGNPLPGRPADHLVAVSVVAGDDGELEDEPEDDFG